MCTFFITNAFNVSRETLKQVLNFELLIFFLYVSHETYIKDDVYMKKYFNLAIKEAELAYNEGNVPVGAVIVKDNVVISSNHNRKNTDNVSIYHAELLCIMDACKELNSWYLNDCVMYVTLKPCKMCEAAIAEARIRNAGTFLEF